MYSHGHGHGRNGVGWALVQRNENFARVINNIKSGRVVKYDSIQLWAILTMKKNLVTFEV